MKRIAIFLIILMFTAVSVMAQTEYIDEPAFLPVSPTVMAQGGSFLAVSNGYDSLFYNPAGFKTTEGLGKLTLMSTSLWTYMNPATAQELLSSITSQEGQGENEMGAYAQTLNNEITSGGFGVGTSIGAGWVGNGLGIGTALVIDSMLYGGRSMLDMSGDLHGTLGVVLGYALQLDLMGIKLNVGADLRPMYRIHAVLSNNKAITMAFSLLSNDLDTALSAMNEAGGLTGFGVGVDAGAIADFGLFQVALSLRDILGTEFSYTRSSFDTILADLQAGDPSEGTALDGDVKYVIPMDISAGIAMRLDLLEPFIGLKVHADLKDIIGVIKYRRSPWTLLHIGAEATLLKILKARVGFNQGYITMGAGAHLLFFDVNVALFTRELGRHLGDQPNSGATIEVAIRL